MNRATTYAGWLIFLWLLSGTGIQPAYAEEHDRSFFYEQLSPYGNWVENPIYGWVWYPNNVLPDWRPYTDGRWIDTDDYGWMWEGNEDWGWACYHYGRWLWTEEFGWVWAPGYDWAPAWVAWRYGDGYIGWTPLPPWVNWDWGTGLVLGDYDLNDIAWSQWIFVDEDDFLSNRLSDHIVIAPRNITIIGRTRNVTSIVPFEGHIVNRSISADQVTKDTGRPIKPLHAVEVGGIGALRLPALREGEVNVFQPKIARGPADINPRQFQTIEKRHEVERGNLQQRHQAEVEFLDRQQQLDRSNPGVNEDDLRIQQEREQGALSEQHQREERALQFRQEQEVRGPSMRFEGGPSGPASESERAAPSRESGHGAQPGRRKH